MKHPYHQFTFHRNTVRIAAAGISLLIGLAPMQTMAQVRTSQDTWQVVQTAKKSSKGKKSSKASKSVPQEYKNALAKAQSYSDMMYMSKQGIYDQLTSEYGEGFSADAAQYAVDHVDADWKANALEKAKEYYTGMAMSKSAVYDQLTSEYGEQFTADEAQYAVDHMTEGEAGTDSQEASAKSAKSSKSSKSGKSSKSSKSSKSGKGASKSSKSSSKSGKEGKVSQEYKNALAKAQSYSDTMYMSKQGIYDQLTSEYGEGFSADAAQYAVDHVDADWKQNALEKGKEYYTEMSMSKSAVYDQLVSEYGEQFTADEAQYAIDHLDD